MKQYLKKYKLTLGCMLGILIALLMPLNSLPSEGSGSPLGQVISSLPHLDKLVHSGLFALLTLVHLFENRGSQGKNQVFCLVILFFFGVLTEVLQKITGYRSFDLLDILADVLGICLGYAVTLCLNRGGKA